MITAGEILNASILIVDDEPMNVLLLENMLLAAGYSNLTSTRDPRAVCGLHREHRYDLILLDLKMPGMDGFQVMEALKEIDVEDYVPILVVTAQKELNLKALSSGAKDFLSKPFDLVEAKTRIHNMLELRLLYKRLGQQNRALESLSLHDPLTGLPNRRLLLARLGLALAYAQRHGGGMAVLYLDLDGFNPVNDTLGHDAGDQLLTIVAGRLQGAVRRKDTVARVGGDEFVIALGAPEAFQGLPELAAKILGAVAQPILLPQGEARVSASAGLAIYPGNGHTIEALLAGADRALFEAKREVKNTFRMALEVPPARAAG